MTTVPTTDETSAAPAAAPRTGAAGSSFYAGMRILPAAQRQAMFDIYGFCRAVDDIADGDAHQDDPRGAMARWRADLDAAFAGRPAGLAQPLAPHIRAYGLKRADFLAVVDGMEMDLDGPIVAPDRATLDLYVDRVACAVGRLSTPIFGIDDAAGAPLAHHLGRALQFTNILRDLDEDAERGRLYIAREDLAEAGVPPGPPKAALAAPHLDKARARMRAGAHADFVAADAIMRDLGRKATKAPRLMAYAYADVLKRLEARGFAPPRARVGVRKARLALAALWWSLA